MKIEIWNDETKPETVLRLRLQHRDDGSVTLSAVNANGQAVFGGCLLSIDPKGIHRHHCISPDLGLPLDKNGRVKLVGEE